MDLVNSLLTDLRRDLSYVKREEEKIWSADGIYVCNTVVPVHSDRYTVVAVRKDSTLLGPEVISFCRSVSLHLPVVHRGVDAFDHNGEICFTYDPCTTDLEKIVKDEGLHLQVLRGILRAMHYLQYRGVVHGKLENAHKIVITKIKREVGHRYVVKLTGFGEQNRLDQASASKDCRDLANILQSLDIKDQSVLRYLKPVIRHLRVDGCKGLHESYGFLEPHQKWDYLFLLYGKVMNGRLIKPFTKWGCDELVHPNSDWRDGCISNDHLRDFYYFHKLEDRDDEPYKTGAGEFLRFCRNLAEHHRQYIRGNSKMTPNDLLQAMDAVWPDFFNKLTYFCAGHQIQMPMFENPDYL